ncbi:hypothetical protein ATL17_0555 [Maritalea mobilis]|uniref:Uncharacterized protein n=1 Tax=Maritalea mobilis TaxID=483324 RepID=A0A4R6VUW4_9HYPH|nr:hypothetical protein [Maritalea mobilis]TDQ66557.1 hypothetical protein ATL17_0555 [Maritalea mobilis]
MSNDPTSLGTQYTLNVNNQNSLLQTFVLFQKMPVTSKPSTDPISLAWIVGSAAGGSASNPSKSRFTWFIDYSINAGYLQQEGSSASPRKFQTATQIPVKVDDTNLVNVSYDGTFPNGAPYFDGVPGNTTSGIIAANSDDKIPTNAAASSAQMDLALGIAMNRKPAVSVQLLPNIDYVFTPHPEYYIMSAKYSEGDVIDIEETSHAYKVEFDGVTDITLNFTEQNLFQQA